MTVLISTLSLFFLHTAFILVVDFSKETLSLKMIFLSYILTAWLIELHHFCGAKEVEKNGERKRENLGKVWVQVINHTESVNAAIIFCCSEMFFKDFNSGRARGLR